MTGGCTVARYKIRMPRTGEDTHSFKAVLLAQVSEAFAGLFITNSVIFGCHSPS